METKWWIIIVIVALLVGGIIGYYIPSDDEVIAGINNPACSKLKNSEVCDMASTCSWYQSLGGGKGFCGGAM